MVCGHAKRREYGARWWRVESGEVAGRRKEREPRSGTHWRLFACPRCGRLMNAEPQDVKVGEEARRRGRRKHCGRRGLIDVIAVVVAFVNNAGAVGALGAAASASVARGAAGAAVVAAVKGRVIVVVGVDVAVAAVASGAAAAGAVEVVHTAKTALEVRKSLIEGREGGDCLQPN